MLALLLGSGSPSFLSYFDFEVEAVLFVPALGPQLSNFSIVKFLFYLFILYFLLSGFSQSAFGGLVTSECDSSRMKKHEPVVFLPIHSYVQGYSKHTQSKHLSLSDSDIYWEVRHILL